MKGLIFSGLFALLTFSSYCQFRQTPGSSYILSMQVDSSEYFIIGGQPSKADKAKYSFEPVANYTITYGNADIWSDVSIYNSRTNKSKSLFKQMLVAVYPFQNVMEMSRYGWNYYSKDLISGTSKDHLIILARMDKYNSDKILDSEDPAYIFISMKDGTGLRQLNPDNTNVTNWRLSKDGNTIFVTLQEDINKDKKFNEDEQLYQIDLSTDISTIKLIKAIAE